MGLAIGGKTYRLVNEQARRISGCNLVFYADKGDRELMRRGGFVDGAITMTDVFGDQPALWQERVLLNEEFYRALREHPVPLSEPALRAIGPDSMVIDTYIWLAYRLTPSSETRSGLAGPLQPIWSRVQAHQAVPGAIYRSTATRPGGLSRRER